jgi:DNA-binding PadR family transcriptional regulator
MIVKREDLNMSSYVVLGLLDYQPDTTGYELRQLADRTISFLWSTPSMSQIYAELDRLNEAKLVRRKDGTNGKRPRTSYRLTAAGRKALQTWAADDPYEAPTFHHGVALRVLLGRGNPQSLITLLESHLRETHALISALTDLSASLGDSPKTDDGLAHARIVTEWGTSFFSSEERATRTAIRALRDLMT